MQRILIVGPAWVGDMVMAQALFKYIKQMRPEVSIDVLAPAWSLPLLARMPEVSEGIALAAGHGQLAWGERSRLGKSLRGRYEQAIVLPNSFKSALVPFWARIPRRTGWRGEMRYGLLNDLRYLDKTRYPLMIERFLALALPAQADLPVSYPKPALVSSVETQASVLVRYGLSRSTQPILVLCPGAEFGPSKRWPEQHYAAVASAKLAEGWAVWILGSPKDVVVADEIMRLTDQRCVNLAGRTQLVDAVDLLALATQVLTNDSGLMHIAAAVQTPLIALYGSTSTAFTPPLSTQSKVLQLDLPCQPCFKRECPLQHHRCMQDLLPGAVLREMKS